MKARQYPLPLLQCLAWTCVVIVGIFRQHVRVRDEVGRTGEQETSLRASLDDTNPKRRRARFLMGIFTVESDREMRQAVRRELHSYNNSRICSFGSHNGRMPSPPLEHCELIYTFVIGANPNGTRQIVNNWRNDVLSMPPKDFNTALEPDDMTFLNIQENTHEGKTPTWFHYAYQVMTTYDIDYAIKSDSRTNLLVDNFFQIADSHLPRGGSMIYAGRLSWSMKNHHIYMSGEFFVLSRELAFLVASISLRNHKRVLRKEDSDVGLIVTHRQALLHVIALQNGSGFPWRIHKELKESLSH